MLKIGDAQNKCQPNDDIRFSVAWRLGWVAGQIFLYLRRLRFLLGIHREQHVVVEAVPAVVVMLAEVEVNLCRFWQPERSIFFREWNRPVFDDLMFAEQADFRHGLDHIGLDANNLKFVSGDPCASLEVYTIDGVSHLVTVHMIRMILSLPKVNEPGGLSAPVSQSFADHFK